ncbi:MAG: hypothetical protein K8J09_01445 [Planctomycetes bacterium]|nr:hypothetical protein [Planctomycetota bacterium]MCC7396652.1 hypothetical protein [Planctomycetota bacterium]
MAETTGIPGPGARATASFCLFLFALVGCAIPGNHTGTPRPVTTPASASPVWDVPPGPGQAPVSQYVRRLAEDHRGAMWFGTNDEGAICFDGREFAQASAATALAGHAVRGIVEDRFGVLWFATDVGLFAFDGAAWRRYTTADGLPHDDLWSLCLRRDGELWLGGIGGLCRFDGERFTAVPLPPLAMAEAPRLTRQLVWAIAEDNDGEVWCGTDGGGLVRYDHDGGTLFTAGDGLVSDNVTALLAARDGTLWIGAPRGGVTRFDGAKFTVVPELADLRAIVWTLFEDRDGDIWLGSAGDGLVRIRGTSPTRFGPGQGLGNRHVQSVLQTRDGRLWFGTSGGLYRLDGDRLMEMTRPAGPSRASGLT